MCPSESGIIFSVPMQLIRVPELGHHKVHGCCYRGTHMEMTVARGTHMEMSVSRDTHMEMSVSRGTGP